jgi:cysteine desulfurase / selenocysteine lyase
MNYESEFNLDNNIIHVNHAAVGPWPTKTAEAVKSFAEENTRIGSKNYLQWVETETDLRAKLAQLINAASVNEIALLKNTSEGLSVIAYGLDWHAGDNIVIAKEEFPSNRIVWESLKSQGVEVRLVSLSNENNPEQKLIDQFDNKTRLLSISAVQYASGLRMDLSVLGQACKGKNILYCVDAIQHIGALQFDAQAINADFVVADGHKWMLGPEGLALFYCREELLETLKLNQFGWHMVENFLDFSSMDNWQPAKTARRFECGSPNMLAVHALHSSIDLLLTIGMQTIEQLVLEKVQYLIDGLANKPGISVLSPTDIKRHAGIFTFKKSTIENEALYNELVSKGAICALRGGGIRFSPHFHNSKEQLDTLIDWVLSY